MSNELYNNLKKLRYKINNNYKDVTNINYITNYEDNIILNEKLKNFLNSNKEQDTVKNIYSYILNYIKKENLLSENKRIININSELKILFNIDETHELNIINLGIHINTLLFK